MTLKYTLGLSAVLGWKNISSCAGNAIGCGFKRLDVLMQFEIRFLQ